MNATGKLTQAENYGILLHSLCRNGARELKLIVFVRNEQVLYDVHPTKSQPRHLMTSMYPDANAAHEIPTTVFMAWRMPMNARR